MTMKDFATMIDNTDYNLGRPFSSMIISMAKDLGYVLIYGTSDDLVEAEGAVRDEDGSCRERVYLSASGFRSKPIKGIPSIKSDFGSGVKENGKDVGWTFTTKLPHETFHLIDDYGIQSIGLIIDIKDLAPKSKEV